MEITGDGYSVRYDAETTTVYCEGIMQSTHQGYEPVKQLLNEVAALGLSQMILNLQELEELNSSGLSTLLKFANTMNDNNAVKLVILASKQYSWQTRSLKRFRAFVSGLQIEWEE